jgi:hypothetical protein
MGFSIGTDPEFILLDKNNNPKSAIGILKNKKNSNKIKKNSYYYDNVLCECTVSPSFNKKEFKANIKESLQTLFNLVKPYNLTLLPCVNFTKKELKHPDSRIIGCAPEYCAYELNQIDSRNAKKIIKNTGFRTAGGHIHLGNIEKKDHNSCLMLIRCLDLFLGIPSLIMDSPESFKRRRIYGAAGGYRQPDYGIEYRALGNFWLSSPDLVDLIYDLCDYSIKFVMSGEYEKFWIVDESKLNSDDFWNNGGDPASCYQCIAYDSNLLRKLFFLEKKDFLKKGTKIINFCFEHLPKNLVDKISMCKKTNANLKSNWDIKIFK